MLTGESLGEAIKTAMALKEVSPTDIARHFGIKGPSVHGWLKTGRVSKGRIPKLFGYFSDTVGPAHWGLTDPEEISFYKTVVKQESAIYEKRPNLRMVNNLASQVSEEGLSIVIAMLQELAKTQPYLEKNKSRAYGLLDS